LTKGLDIARSLGLPIYSHAFGAQSYANLSGVLPGLVDVAQLAIRICEYDGTVIAGGGLRTHDQALQNVQNGTGILDSRHRKQSDGWGHAIDLIALTYGRVDWQNLVAFREMARAVKVASAILEIPIRQGCDWNMNGKLQEAGTKEWDWPHFEDPIPFHLPAAENEMLRYRREIGLS
jgi:peptidoglycan L-alanyl-D-glutamate endopeptidase CwlK